MAEYVIATYRYQLPDDTLSDAEVLQKTEALAEKMAIGQTLGTAQAEVVSRLAQYVGHVRAVSRESQTCARFEIAFPSPEVIPADLAMLLSITFGKVSMLGALQLVDLELPPSLSQALPGPQFGVDGIRCLLKRPSGPLLMTIFKPCVGLSPDELAAMLRVQAEAGCHMVMDDELLADACLDTALARVKACRVVIDQVEAETGHRLLYAPHLTGPAHELHARAKAMKAVGAEAFLFSYWVYGLPLLASLAQNKDIDVPILGHPAMAGAFYGLPGIDQSLLFGLLPRLSGCDLVLSPSPEGNIRLSHETVEDVCRQLRRPFSGIQAALPVPSAGITSSMVPALIRAYGDDVVINAGTGVYDHPSGPKAAIAEFLAAMTPTLGVR
jgi:2,3-diketo-5-methylthiopentyl-1-phosphate enolase